LLAGVVAAVGRDLFEGRLATGFSWSICRYHRPGWGDVVVHCSC